MADRKNINKYYPTDYDPSKVKREKRDKSKPQQAKVRIALPMNITCSNCRNFMARGSKFNSRKETVEAEAYLGQKVFRFYFRCKRCFQELTIKTDPKNSDYVAEHNCTAGYVHHKASMEEAAAEEAEKEDLEQFDKMKALEMKSMESLRDAEVSEAIDTVLTMHAQRQLIGTAELMKRALDCTIEEIDSADEFDEEELAELHAMQQYQANKGKVASSAIDVEEEDEDEDPIAARSRQMRERMLQIQRDNLNLTKDDDAQPTSTDAKDANGTSSANPQTASTASSSAPSTSTTTKPTSLSKSGIKPPIAKPLSLVNVKPVSSSTPSSSTIVISTAKPSSSTTPSLIKPTGAPLLTTSKYRRDDDDE